VFAHRITAPLIAARSFSIGPRTESCASTTPTAASTATASTLDGSRFEVRAKVLSALRHLGFRETETGAAIEQLRRDVALAQAPFDACWAQRWPGFAPRARHADNERKREASATRPESSSA